MRARDDLAAGRRRAARAVMARRGELGMDREELAAKAGIDPKTLYNLEVRGRWPIAVTRSKIETALRWPSGEMEHMVSQEEFPPDVLADEFGEDKAARLRRVLGGRGETGAAVLRAIEDEFRSPPPGGAPGESGQARAAGEQSERSRAAS